MQIFSKELLMAAGDLHGMYEWTTPGTYSFTLERQTKAMIYMVGGGGDRMWFEYGSTRTWFSSAGGAAFVGGVILPNGTYSVEVGHALNANDIEDTVITHSTIGDLIICGSAGHGTDQMYYGNLTEAGHLIKSSNLVIQAGTVQIESDGNPPNLNAGTGGASLYMGYGKGSDASTSNYTNGYFKIEW